MSTTFANYVGRKVDVLAFDGAKLSGEALLSQALAQPGGSGKIVAGVQKLAQRFLLEFFTEQGSMPYNPDRGCLFMYEARVGYFLTHLDVMGAFARAVSTIKRNLRNEETDSDPDDERFGSATLDSLSIEPGVVKLYVNLKSLAGSNRTYLMPITVSL